MLIRSLTCILLLSLSLPSSALRADADGYGGSDPVHTLVLQARDAIVRIMRALDNPQTQRLIGRLASCDRSPRPCRIAGELQNEAELDAHLRDSARRASFIRVLESATFVVESDVFV